MARPTTPESRAIAGNNAKPDSAWSIAALVFGRWSTVSEMLRPAWGVARQRIQRFLRATHFFAFPRRKPGTLSGRRLRLQLRAISSGRGWLPDATTRPRSERRARAVNTAHHQSFALRAKPASESTASSGSASVSRAPTGCPVCSTFDGRSAEAATRAEGAEKICACTAAMWRNSPCRQPSRRDRAPTRSDVPPLGIERAPRGGARVSREQPGSRRHCWRTRPGRARRSPPPPYDPRSRRCELASSPMTTGPARLPAHRPPSRPRP